VHRQNNSHHAHFEDSLNNSELHFGIENTSFNIKHIMHFDVLVKRDKQLFNRFFRRRYKVIQTLISVTFSN